MVMANKRTRGSRGSPACTGGGSITAANALPGTNTQENWNLDGLGNWRATGFIPVAGSSTTDQRNHNYVNEITQSVTSNLSPVTFVYDGATGASNGNLKNDGTLIYAYDSLNRPIQINRVSDGLVIATYLYDAMNRRVRKTISNGGLTGNIPNGTTDYIWSGWQVVEERNSSNAPVRQYVWGSYIDECIQLTTLAVLGPQSLPAGAYYLLQDLLYRAVALTNSAGGIVEAYDTDAYGNTIIFTGPGTDGIWFTDDDLQSSYGANEIILCGYRYDPETELYYARNRTYNAALGRWLQRDPIGYGGGVNFYEYAKDGPGSRFDPLGLMSAMDWVTPGAHYKPGRGTFRKVSSFGLGRNQSAILIHFQPSQDWTKGCVCTKIGFVQYERDAFYSWVDPFTGFGHGGATLPRQFRLDKAFPYPHPAVGRFWTGPVSVWATLDDQPGPSVYLPFAEQWIFQARDVAVCLEGKEKGDSYGAIYWGFYFDWIDGLVSRYILGVGSAAGRIANNPNIGVLGAEVAPVP